MSLKSVLAMSALALAAGVTPIAHAGIGDTYQASFQGATFTFYQNDADTLTFTFASATGLTGDWATAAYLGAFDLKDLGVDFGTYGATANGPGAVNLVGLNTQLSASSVDCQAAGTPPGSICFDISPDYAFGAAPFSLAYTIDLTGGATFNIASTGVHLQIALTAVQNGAKVGSLYSQDVGLASSSSSGLSTSSSSSSGLSTSSSGVPEPATGSMALLGLGLLLGSFVYRRTRRS